MSLPNELMVSVRIITYNHGAFIAQAIESVLAQQTDFPYEVIIGEDDSTDNTRTIVKDFSARYPDQVRLLLNDRKDVIYINGRPTGKWNFANSLKYAKGKYVALLDGDDYWTNPHKLQKQVDFMERNPDCSISFHNVSVVGETGVVRKLIADGQKEKSSLQDLIRSDFMPTCSIMFRRQYLEDFPDWFYSLIQSDWPLEVMMARRGWIGYINETLGAYRVHQSGMWSGGRQLDLLTDNLKFYEYIDPYLNFEFHAQIKEISSKLILKISMKNEKLGNTSEARKFALRYLKDGFPLWLRDYKQTIKYFMQLFLPDLYRVVDRIRAARHRSARGNYEG